MSRRLGEAGVDAFMIVRIAGGNPMTTSRRYVHPTPEALERAFEKPAAVVEGGMQDGARVFSKAGLEPRWLVGSNLPIRLPLGA